MKATAIAPANVGLIKYWGRADEKLRLPENGSISVNLSHLLTKTTVEFDRQLKNDQVTVDGRIQPVNNRVSRHLDLMRQIAGQKTNAKVVSANNFPTGTGLSSSSSGFAALTLAVSEALNLSLPQKDLSVLARQGSGSACRSIPDGFVQWYTGQTSELSYSKSIFPPDHWQISDVVAVVSNEKKNVSSSEGQKSARSSPFYQTRLENINKKISDLRRAIKNKDFRGFGKLIEEEALELHSIMLTSKPSLIYWSPGTLAVMKRVKLWREQYFPVYFTVNTGQDIHIFCNSQNAQKLRKLLSGQKEVREIIINRPSVGARISDKHLF